MHTKAAEDAKVSVFALRYLLKCRRDFADGASPRALLQTLQQLSALAQPTDPRNPSPTVSLVEHKGAAFLCSQPDFDAYD